MRGRADQAPLEHAVVHNAALTPSTAYLETLSPPLGGHLTGGEPYVFVRDGVVARHRSSGKLGTASPSRAMIRPSSTTR